MNTRLRAINADEITPGNVLTGDQMRPHRFGTGTRVTAVDHERGWVIVRTDSNGTMQFMAWESLYVAVGPRVRRVAPAEVQPGDEVAEPGRPGGPFYRVLRNGAVSLFLHACPIGHGCSCPDRESLTVRSLMKTHASVFLRGPMR